MPVCLNVGCHDIHLEGFINIDIDHNMKPDLLADCTMLKEHFKENSVDFIYCGHFLEHLSLEVGKQVVCDFLSILRPYGTVIAVVPDYLKGICTPTIEERERILLGEGTHKILMDIGRLKSYFTSAGFLTVIQPQLYEIPHCPYPHVDWQTAVVAIKHDTVIHRGPLP
jgi:predicted SAM-dependent methyltransferase